MNRDLTRGEPTGVLLRFCLPLFASVLFQQLYNIADSFVAGKFIGNDALAAVGNSYEITLIFIAFSFGLNTGCSVNVSRLFGAGEIAKMKTAISTALVTGAAICAVLMGFGFGFGEGLLLRIQTPTELMADSLLYLNVYLLGFPFVMFYNVFTGVFSALGDSKTPFLFLVCSSLSNIAVDVLFVTAFGMGVNGVAWATFLCQGVSCLLSGAVLLRRLNGMKAVGKISAFSKQQFIQLVKIAVPSTLQQSFISVGNILIQGMINGFGSGVIAGYSASVKLNNLVITSLTTFGTGVSNYSAQNLGAGKMMRIRQGFRSGLKLILPPALGLSCVYVFGARGLVTLFLSNPTGDALATGMLILRIFAPFYFLDAVKLLSDGILRGTGHMDGFMTGTFVDLAIRVILAGILSQTELGALGIWISWPIGWLVGTAISVSFYWKKVGKQIKASFDNTSRPATAPF